MTKKSRGDLLADDFVSVPVCQERKKETLPAKPINSELSKKQNLKPVNGRLPSSASSLGVCAQKRKHPEGSNEECTRKPGLSDATVCNKKSYAFKKLAKRVAREFPNSVTDGNQNETPSLYSKKPAAHRPDAVHRNRTFGQHSSFKSSPVVFKNNEKTNGNRIEKLTADVLRLIEFAC